VEKRFIKGYVNIRFILFAVVFLISNTVLGFTAHAEAPMVKTQAPGFYRIMVGDYEVTALSDGTNMMPAVQLLQGNKDKIKALLGKNYLDETVETSINAFLINTGSKLVLVDTGIGKMGTPAEGKLVDNLRATGYQPEQVDEILLTHLHNDHVAGLVANSERVFKNATVYANKLDVDYWLSDSNMNAAPAEYKSFYQIARDGITPYINAGKFQTFEGNMSFLPGISGQEAVGHTPGHTMYLVESKGQKLLLMGDVIHVAAVQFEDPLVTIAYDVDSAKAAAARKEVLDEVAKSGLLIGGAHLSFPGFGHVQANGHKGYNFLPLNYSSLN
jgi:glyoxylase-like metal-dependent hydrolase (beta-lactamase superfamily II)